MVMTCPPSSSHGTGVGVAVTTGVKVGTGVKVTKAMGFGAGVSLGTAVIISTAGVGCCANGSQANVKKISTKISKKVVGLLSVMV